MLLLLAMAPLGCAALLLNDLIVSYNGPCGPESVDLVGAPILFAADDFIGVHIAAHSLAVDLEAITGQQSNVLQVDEVDSLGEMETAIIAGSISSPLIHHLTSSGAIDVSQIEGKWETFKIEVVENPPIAGLQRAVVISGSDKRGAIFGIHTLAEECGQSPYHWFADVPAKRHSSLCALPTETVLGEPSVKYRGLFINDEAPALTHWWSAQHNTSHQPLDTEFYAHVFDLLLRLKANYLWPAMWKSSTPSPGNIFFTDDPGNQQLADDYGIVVSTSHHEPMQRATNEWDESKDGAWNWATNKANMADFMEEGIVRTGNNESYITLGLRGLGDEASSNSLEAMQDVFDTQRDIIKRHYGAEDAVNQVWALYKEVAAYYEAGLDAPEDVTLLWPDDNHGNLYRLPTGDEGSRKGGVGVYFHLEYVGQPMSYKWANSNNLPRILKELTHASLRGANHIWIINVGDIKPMELPFRFIMDLAWDTSSITFDGIPQYLERYSIQEFGELEEFAEEIGAILLEYSHLVGMRRFEHLLSTTYSMYNFEECERIRDRWQTLAARAAAIYDNPLLQDSKSAFFQLVYYPVVAGATFYNVKIGRRLNHKYSLERRNSANAEAQQVLDALELDYDLLEAFDNLNGGKWRHMLSQAKYDREGGSKNWASPSRDIVADLSFVQLRKDMPYTQGNLGVWAEGSDQAILQTRWAESVDASMPTTNYAPVLPVLTTYGAAPRVELFHRGDHRKPLSFSIEPPVPWITVEPATGTLDADHPDQTVRITVDWPSVPAGFDNTVEIPVTATPAEYPYFELIHAPVRKDVLPSDFHGFPEGPGYISMEAPHFHASSDDGAVSFDVVPYLGSRSESGCIAVRPFQAAREGTADSAWTEYNFYLFGSRSVKAVVYITGGLDTDPALKMQFSLGVDGNEGSMARVLGDAELVSHAGVIPPEWQGQVMNQVWKKTVELGTLGEGAHTLRWRVNSPEVYLEKIVLWTGSELSTYLGPPESVLV